MIAAFLALSFAVQTGNLTTVEGKVVDSATGLPVPGARVILARFGQPVSAGTLKTEPAAEPDRNAKVAAVTTGDDGRFRFRLEDLTAFHLFADARGYVPAFSAGSRRITLLAESATAAGGF